ncbi:ferritin-like domain-containing protein [Hymenobacter terrenus]|uniref:ferritin-like domain-containing protein n=1 Tax=Hymenobacter terrenus TaxID=1629124 RepID=UPI000696528F|nr:PA2169 family four-helix-bundle protein [Hymenobacter terrenus]
MSQLQSSLSVSTDDSNAPNSLINQAQQWLKQGNVSEILGKVPTSLKNFGSTSVTSFNKLSTTQKVAGGALLALGATYLLRRGRKGRAQAATLHELLYFVNDRIEGYQRAVEESKDTRLRGYYKQLVIQSQQFANQLNAYLSQEGIDEETSTTLKGKLYRGWMDAKAALTGRDEKAILGSNIYGEEWALRAYEEALDDRTLSGPVRRAVRHQYAQSQRTYQELKKLAVNY